MEFMEFRDIEYFAVLAKHGHVGRAAEALGLSPPALSVSLKRLETSMQAKLFDRTPKGVELTVTGSALLAQVRILRLARDDVLREAADLSQGRAGHLRIGTGPGLSVHMLPGACHALLQEAPRVTLKVTVGDRGAFVEALRTGELDLAVTYLPSTAPEGLVQEYLCEDEFIIYCSVHHRLAKKKQVTLADIAQEDWAVAAVTVDAAQALAAKFQEHGLPAPRIRIDTGSLQIRHYIIASSNLLGFSSRPVVRSSPQYRYAELRVKGLSHRRRSGVIYRKAGYLSPAGRRFVEILKATARRKGEDMS